MCTIQLKTVINYYLVQKIIIKSERKLRGEIDNMNSKKIKKLRYEIRRRNYIRWINQKPPKWKFISYIKCLKERPTRP